MRRDYSQSMSGENSAPTLYYQMPHGAIPTMRPSVQNAYPGSIPAGAIPVQRPSYGTAAIGIRKPVVDDKSRPIPLAAPHNAVSYGMPHHGTMLTAPRPQSNVVVASPAQSQAAKNLSSLMDAAVNFCDMREMDNHAVNQETQRFRMEINRIHQTMDVFSAVIGATQNKGSSKNRRVAAPPTANEPPFVWEPSIDYTTEFNVTGRFGEVVTKEGDFEDQGWVIPVAGSLRMLKGSLYRWGVQILRKCPHRPQLQFGIHGVNHDRPWRLITTSRCSRSRDDEPWQDRPGGDRLIDEGDTVWIEVDLRGVTSTHGTMSYAINDETWEVAFTDIPLFDIENQMEAPAAAALMPVVCMGGHGCAVKVLPF